LVLYHLAVLVAEHVGVEVLKGEIVLYVECKDQGLVFRTEPGDDASYHLIDVERVQHSFSTQ
jgi:hypothetical protein